MSAARSKKASEVLRYWRTLLKYQEALGVRPRARRAAQAGSTVPNLVEPAAGQDYFKLPFAGAERFLIERASLDPLPLDAERAQFCEDWLAQQYRRADDDDSGVAQLVLFPAVHLAKDELAGVLRFPVELDWLVEDRPFAAPWLVDRAARATLAAPTALRLSHPGKDPEQSLPFFVDSGLLTRTLQVDPEDVEGFFVALRADPALSPRRMLLALCELLEAPLDGAAKKRAASSKAEAAVAAEVLLTRLHTAVTTRLAAVRSKSRAYPVALIVSSARSRATWHVQRDLDAAMTALAEDAVDDDSALLAYLGGRAQPARPERCLGRWPDAPLTPSQKHALEHALGARLAAVQGPPGTGKTRLILNAVVHQLIEKFAPVASDRPPNEDVLLVTSTNNRAVDNVMDPLCQGALADCPLALRLGNRDVMGSVTTRTLERMQTWLTRQAPASESELAPVKQRFATRYAAVRAALEPERKLKSLEHELTQLERDLATLRESTAEGPNAALLHALAVLGLDLFTLGKEELARRGEAVREPLARALPMLEALSRRAEEGDDALDTLERGYRRFSHEHLSALNQALGVELALDLPPAGKDAASVEAWEEGLENALGPLRELKEALAAAPVNAERPRPEALETRIAALRLELETQRAVVAAPRLPGTELEQRLTDELIALYGDALELRALWLRSHKAELGEALRTALAQARNARSLRTLLSARRGAGSWLKKVFPCFGCTLLSLGNAFAADPGGVQRVIVDEAGQCHGAYAVSALLRARSVLLIGDVHQLEPVHDLGADDERRIQRGLKLGLSEKELEPFRMYDESGHSAQSLADRAVSERPTLREHFRCQPEIIALCEAWCNYGMTPFTKPASLAGVIPELCAPVLFMPVPGEQQRFAGSWQNDAELGALIGWVRRLLAHGVPPSEIALITPYRGQAEAIFRALRAERMPIEQASDDLEEPGLFGRQGGIALGTVHRFQGGERRVVLFSTTVTERSRLAFVNERVNLLNVAASRAKEHLLVLGHEATLRAGSNTRILVDGQPRLAPAELSFRAPGPALSDGLI